MQLIAGPSSAALYQLIGVCSKVHKQCPPSKPRKNPGQEVQVHTEWSGLSLLYLDV